MRTAKRYVGFDVHKEAIAVSVRGESGKIQQRSVIETNAEAVITLLRGLGNATWVAFEEGTQAQWLCEICSPYETQCQVFDVHHAPPSVDFVTGLPHPTLRLVDPAEKQRSGTQDLKIRDPKFLSFTE